MKQIQRWLPALIVGAALAGATSLCQAQILYTNMFNSSGDAAAWTVGFGNGTVTYNPTNGNLAGSLELYITSGNSGGDQIAAQWNFASSPFPSPLNSSKYLSVSFDYYVDPSSGTEPTGPAYGYLQPVLRNASFSFAGLAYLALNSAGTWQHVSAGITASAYDQDVNLTIQVQAGSSQNYSSPVIVYIDNVVITPIPNPLVFDYFTNASELAGAGADGLTASIDTTVDETYSNPVSHATMNVTPAGSLELVATTPTGYPGYEVNPTAWVPANFEFISFDLYYDGPTGGTDYGGFQFFIADGAPYGYSWTYVTGVSFNAGMVGKWTHYDLPCASSGITNAQGYTFQATPAGGGTNPFTFHVDNVQVWNPVTIPAIQSITPNSIPGGVQMTLDGDGTANLNDQEGICSPKADNAQTNFFWINQFPASYSMSLTNFPAPAAAPSFDAHIYVWNGDTIQAFNGLFGYNQTYSGPIYNVGDAISFDVQNGTNGGVVASLGWKTNLFNSNISNNNVTAFSFPSMASANGTWTLNFTDNTHGNITAPDNSVNSFTLPDFVNDPNYSGNFTPLTSAVSVGVFKNGNVLNNGQSAVFSHVSVSNTSGGNPLVNYNESFPGPGLGGDIAWQVAEYYQFAANRILWVPGGTAYWLSWTLPDNGYSVQSTTSLLGPWASAGITYTYPGLSGTNRVAAVPAASLPAGNADFFRLANPSP